MACLILLVATPTTVREVVTLLRGNVDSNLSNTLQKQSNAKLMVCSRTHPLLLPDKSSLLLFLRTSLAPATSTAMGIGTWLPEVGQTTRCICSLAMGVVVFLLRRQSHYRECSQRFVTGEINRADGLTDLVLAVNGEQGSQVLVFEGPEGALRAEPETFSMPAAVTSLALGQF